MSVDVPHLALPFRFAAGAANVVEQDSLDEVRQCVYAVLATPIGHRPDLDEFGIEEQALRQGGADVDGLIDAVSRWEPRAPVDLTASEIVDLAQQVRVEVRPDTT